MSDDGVALLYERLAARFTETVQAVPDDAWDRPSACSDWTNREVVEHVAGLHVYLLQGALVELPGGPSIEDDVESGWDRARSAVQGALVDPSTATREFRGFAGTTTLEQVFTTFGAVDLVVHRWDLAHGAGLDDTIPPEDLDVVWDFVHDKAEILAGSDSFGDPVDVGDDASQQARVLGFLGRTA